MGKDAIVNYMKKTLHNSLSVLIILLLFAFGMKSVSKEGNVFLGIAEKVDHEKEISSIEQTVFLITDIGKMALEIADTEGKRIRGLSGREYLADGTGMLFLFPSSGFYGFWMKDMNFSIDILWIDEDFKIVHIEREVHPDTYPKSFTSQEPAKYVLELNAGDALRLDLIVGKRILFENL